MRVFEHFNSEGEPCPICKTKDDTETTLVGIDGTEEGHNMQARQVHVACIELRMSKSYPEGGILYMVMPDFKKEEVKENGDRSTL